MNALLDYLANDLVPHLLFFQLAVLLVILSNLHLLHRARKHPEPDNLPMVSVLIPARNEERNIRRCVQSILEQDYPVFEVLVLDDQSSDATLTILTQLADSNPGLKILAGSPPPVGVTGKNWACDQLAHQARGDLLLFTDADTTHRPQCLRQGVTALAGEGADFLTGFPSQQVVTWGERLLVPFFSWASLSFLPLWLGYRLRWPALSVAVGQFMLFRREAYEQIGGHKSLGAAFVDDLELARRVKAAGLHWQAASISDLVVCRMYPGGREAMQGFTANLFAAFEFRLLGYLFVYVWLAVLFGAPLFVLILWTLGQVHPPLVQLAVTSVAISFIIWALPYREIRLPVGLALLYPLSTLANVVIAFRSVLFSLSGRLSWKGRPIPQSKWKWL